MNKKLLVVFIFVAGVVCSEVESTCASCGSECASSCGTRHFRTCCFNYMRKRSAPEPGLDPGLRLELWLARSRSLARRHGDAGNDEADIDQ